MPALLTRQAEQNDPWLSRVIEKCATRSNSASWLCDVYKSNDRLIGVAADRKTSLTASILHIPEGTSDPSEAVSQPARQAGKRRAGLPSLPNEHLRSRSTRTARKGELPSSQELTANLLKRNKY